MVRVRYLLRSPSSASARTPRERDGDDLDEHEVISVVDRDIRRLLPAVLLIAGYAAVANIARPEGLGEHLDHVPLHKPSDESGVVVAFALLGGDVQEAVIDPVGHEALQRPGRGQAQRTVRGAGATAWS